MEMGDGTEGEGGGRTGWSSGRWLRGSPVTSSLPGTRGGLNLSCGGRSGIARVSARLGRACCARRGTNVVGPARREVDEAVCVRQGG